MCEPCTRADPGRVATQPTNEKQNHQFDVVWHIVARLFGVQKTSWKPATWCSCLIVPLPLQQPIQLTGWGTGTRTPIARFKVWSPTIRRSPITMVDDLSKWCLRPDSNQQAFWAAVFETAEFTNFSTEAQKFNCQKTVCYLLTLTCAFVNTNFVIY